MRHDGQETGSQDIGTSRRGEGTNLSLDEDRGEEICDVIPGAPRSNKQQKIDSVKGVRFDEHGDDGRVHPASCGFGAYCTSNPPVIQGEPYDDHDREDDGERKGNRKIWSAENYVGAVVCESL